MSSIRDDSDDAERLVEKSFSQLDDLALVNLVQAGNHDAFAELVTRHTDRFFALAYRTLQTRQDAEDIVQTAFIKFWQQPSLFDTRSASNGSVSRNEAKFTTWFYRIIVNACHDHLRKTKRYTNSDHAFLESELPETSSEQTGLESRQQEHWRHNCVMAGIRSLPSSQRDALNMVFYCEIPQQQVAEIMGVSRKAVESLLIRAKRSLSQHVAAAKAAADRNEVNYVV